MKGLAIYVDNNIRNGKSYRIGGDLVEMTEMLKEAMVLLYEIEPKSKVKSKAMELYDRYIEENMVINKSQNKRIINK